MVSFNFISINPGNPLRNYINLLIQFDIKVRKFM